MQNIHAALKKFGSNIIFSNGLLDPWSGGRWYNILLFIYIGYYVLFIFPTSDNLWQFMSKTFIFIVSAAVFCRIFLKVLFLWLPKKVKHLIILNLLLVCCMDSILIFFILLFSGAHHLDLRASTENDPDWLIEQRATEIKLIEGWINEYYQKNEAVFDM